MRINWLCVKHRAHLQRKDIGQLSRSFLICIIYWLGHALLPCYQYYESIILNSSDPHVLYNELEDR